MIDITTQPCCGNCPYYEQVVDPAALGSSEGECHRYPPQSVAVHAAGKVQILSHFSRVDSSRICGEHPAFNVPRQAAAASEDVDVTAVG